MPAPDQQPSDRTASRPNEAGRALVEAMTDAGLAGVALPTAGGLAGVVRDLVLSEHQRRHSVALLTAEQLSGMTREELADTFRASPAAVNATVAFLYVVGEAGDDEVLKMIGATLATAIRTAASDPVNPLLEAQLVLRTLRGLTAEHVRLMLAIRDHVGENDVNEEQLRERALVPDRLLRGLLGYLELHGLVDNPHGRFGGGTWWHLSELGRLVLRAGDEVGSRGGKH